VSGESWAEVNITPARLAGVEKTLLLGVVAPLVHDDLAGDAAAWFFAWEIAPVGRWHLRLRVRWRPDHLPRQRARAQRLLAGVLDSAERDGQIGHWWPGSHGVPGEVYEGEAGEYGDLWPLVVDNWQAGCELALALAAKEPDRFTGSQLRYDHWSRRLHMFSNALALGWFYEGYWCLIQASAYLRYALEAGAPAAVAMPEIIGRVAGDSAALHKAVGELPGSQRRG
jgi:hypothetical protein